MSLIKVNSIVHPSGTANNITLDNAGNVTIGRDLIMTSNTLSSPAVAGYVEYDGKALYMTPQDTQRGVVPGMQYFRLNSNLVGLNATGAQNVFGVGCTLSSSTVYAFESSMVFTRSAGTTAHTLSTLFGGTATLNNLNYLVYQGDLNVGFNSRISAAAGTGVFGVTAINTTSATVVTSSMAASTQIAVLNIKGTVSINSGGTFIPQYSLSAAPGGAYSTAAGSYFAIWPIGASGANINVGTWA